MPALKIETLGRVTIIQEEVPVTTLASHKAEALLIYLACTKRPHLREVLAELFWDERTRQQGMANLRVVLTSLRKSISQHMIIKRQSVTFDTDSPYWLDASELETRLCKARQQVLEEGWSSAIVQQMTEAVALYQGDFLEGFHLRDSSGFDEWVVWERERIRRLVIEALNTMLSYCMEQGESLKALGHATHLLQLDPLQETVHRQMMQLLSWMDQRGAALAQYRTCRHLLRAELGVEPMAETIALYDRLRRAERMSQGRGTNYPPRLGKALSVQPFIGREEERDWMIRQWEGTQRKGGRVTLVTGSEGVGKSRLVKEVLRDLRDAGALILDVRCYEYVTEVPYQPITQILRAALSQELVVPQQLSGNRLSELTRLLPDLHDLRPGLSPLHEGVTARQRLFDAIAYFLTSVMSGDGTPTSPKKRSLVLFFDDLQWADSATIDLFHYLIRQLGELPLWIVGAYRPEMVKANHPLFLLHRNLKRENLLHELALSPRKEGQRNTNVRRVASSTCSV